MRLSKYNKSCLIPSLTTVIATIFLAPAAQAQTRVLEEVVVTAQRREQSIMEVPISLEAYSGSTLNQEGLRTLKDLANFSPSVEIEVNSVDQSINVRGLGTSARNYGIESMVPIFVDGSHFGRVSMVSGAFLDLERLEVLRGPQPIAFGHNATAGGFSLVTRDPGPEWQGNVFTEYGNFGRLNFEGGVGGPITDTLGIRVAGKWDREEGYIRDIASDSVFPKHEDEAARVTLQWAPAENFEATFKAGYARRRSEGNGSVVCLAPGHPIKQTEQAMLVAGETSFTNVKELLPLPECDNDGFKRVGAREVLAEPFRPVADIYHSRGRIGFVDITDVRHKIYQVTESSDDAITYNSLLRLDYTFANDINVTSISSYVDYKRLQLGDSDRSFVAGTQSMGSEIFSMWSEEIRFLSPRGGMFEWEAGAFYQQEDSLGPGPEANAKYISSTLRANIRNPNRYAPYWQDASWKSVFGEVTFNFLDDRASIDVGARYTQIDKEAFLDNLVTTWIFDIDPIDPITGRANATSLNGTTVRNVTASMIDCATGHPNCGTYGAGFWTHEYDTRDVPDAWHIQSPIDQGAYFRNPDFFNPDGSNIPFHSTLDDSRVDPQVTLRYRATDNINLYGRWAKAFKGGGFNIRRSTPPPSQSSWQLRPEYAESFEIGAKGNLLDNRALYSVALYTTDVTDRQLETEVPAELDAGSRRGVNAAQQRSRGVEFEFQWSVTNRLSAGLSGAITDSYFVSYEDGGCNDFEFAVADTGPCLTEAESAQKIAEEGLLDLNGDPLADDAFEGTIDRSGFAAPRTPDWKFVANVDYLYPVADRYKVTFSGRTTFSDGYILDDQGFSEVVKYGKRTIANLTLGFGDQADTWKLSFWVRNLLGRSQGKRYYSEFNPAPDPATFDRFSGGGNWLINEFSHTRDYTTYGVLFNYNYN